MSGVSMVTATTRTVMLHTLPLTSHKRCEVRDLVHTYTKAKDRFLLQLHSRLMWRHLDDKRGFRDGMKAAGNYPKGINVHLSDQAAFDAVDTMVRHIESVIARANVKAKISKRYETKELERRFAYTCLKRYLWIADILMGKTPVIESRALSGLDDKGRDQVARYLHRVLKKAFSGNRLPRTHVERSMSLDDTLYTAFEKTSSPEDHACDNSNRCCRQGHVRQYVSTIGIKSGSRITLPLAGVSGIVGNIRVVLDEDADRAVICVPYAIKPLAAAVGQEVAIDWGVTEVLTDSHGAKHGTGLGKLLSDFTEKNNATGKTRGRLHAKVRELRKANPGSKKAKHIARNNLGRKKQSERRRRAQASVRTLSGMAVKEVVYGEGNSTRARGHIPELSSQRPRILGVEDLSHLEGKAKSKKLPRICSVWMRSENQSRIVVHAGIGRTDVKTLNAAYTSQTCPDPACGFVSRDNRHGDGFHCRNPYWDCSWQGDADHVGAMNLLSRIADQKISVFTPYTEVKSILDQRFHCRKESRTRVSGVAESTATAVKNGNQAAGDEGEATAHGRTPSTPQDLCLVGDGKCAVESLSPVHMVRAGETQRLESENKRKSRNA